jgi:hypothetical protein
MDSPSVAEPIVVIGMFVEEIDVSRARDFVDDESLNVHRPCHGTMNGCNSTA